jgi:hypothetical protein
MARPLMAVPVCAERAAPIGAERSDDVALRPLVCAGASV